MKEKRGRQGGRIRGTKARKGNARRRKVGGRDFQAKGSGVSSKGRREREWNLKQGGDGGKEVA